jgi:hypothetical protein
MFIITGECINSILIEDFFTEVQSSADPSEQKPLLAQVALIERQLGNIMPGLPSFEELSSGIIEQGSLSSLVDEDELALIVAQVQIIQPLKSDNRHVNSLHILCR